MKTHIKKIMIGLIFLSFFIIVSFVKNKNYFEKAKTVTTEGSGQTTENHDVKLDDSDIIIADKVEDLKTEDTILFMPGENKTIKYGKLFLKSPNYYVASYTKNKDNVVYNLKLEDSSVYGDVEITLKISESNKHPFENIESMIEDAKGIYDKCDNINVYYNINDSYGITSCYQIEKDNKAYYLVFCNDISYEIESTSSLIMQEMLASFNYLSYEQKNEDVLSEYIVLANIEKEYFYYKEKAKIEIIQSCSKEKFTVEITSNKSNHTIEVKNSEGKNIISSEFFGDNFYDSFVKALDLNGDGYADLQVLKAQGIKNNEYELYIYNGDENNFIKLDIGNYMISHIEVHDGYIYNWVKDGPDIIEPERFLIQGDKLIKQD